MKRVPEHATCSRTIDSPIGGLVLLATPEGLAGLFFGHRVEGEVLPPDDLENPHLDATEHQLHEYFAREREVFDLTFDRRGTAFQEATWEQLSAIPFGETRTYGEIAERLGDPNCVRAVGLANGANPISIIVPCHRVIGADGSLIGFGGGLDLKQKLLTHEGLLLPLF